MVDGWRIGFFDGEVENGDALVAVEGFKGAVSHRRSKGDFATREGFRHASLPALENNAAAVLHAADDVGRRVVERRWALAVLARARGVAGGGRVEAERLVRAFVIVDMPPGVQRPRRAGAVGEQRPAQSFRLERAVETLVLAHGLRVIGP